MTHFADTLKKVGEYGLIEQMQYPIATISGLPNAELHEILEF